MVERKQVLIVEDSDAKLASVISALERTSSGIEIEYAKSVKSALKKLRTAKFSLVIADMSLPTYDVKSRERGGTARPFGGIEIFDFLQINSISTSIIVVSSYPALVDGSTSLTLSDLAAQLKDKYSRLFVGCVFFDSAYLTWEVEFQSLVKDVLNDDSAS
ncbi:response regulator [Herbaspirillum sp. RU 5E]|uniref:response regulator n=1 Tax=Herbaspirillum huttiense TaxID=863372 RepID=UPI0005855FB4|nr:response regulator [Herbaspirillum huttiense]MBW9335695.1 response regulator [Herbaspirillum sp. RU 5E]